MSTRLAWLSRILGPLPLSSTLFQVRRIEGCSVDYLAKEKAGMRGSWEGDWTLTKASLVIKPCWQYHSPSHHHNTTIPQYLLPLHVPITNAMYQHEERYTITTDLSTIIFFVFTSFTCLLGFWSLPSLKNPILPKVTRQKFSKQAICLLATFACQGPVCRRISTGKGQPLFYS